MHVAFDRSKIKRSVNDDGDNVNNSVHVQVLESSQGGRTGSLMGALDNCTTPAGKRLLSQWLCRPLLRIPDICTRQDAVQALISPDCADAVGAARKAFSGQPPCALDGVAVLRACSAHV